MLKSTDRTLRASEYGLKVNNLKSIIFLLTNMVHLSLKSKPRINEQLGVDSQQLGSESGDGRTCGVPRSRSRCSSPAVSVWNEFPVREPGFFRKKRYREIGKEKSEREKERDECLPGGGVWRATHPEY